MHNFHRLVAHTSEGPTIGTRSGHYFNLGEPETSVIDGPLSEAAQTRMCGNSVSPLQAEAVVRANYTPQRYMESDVAIASAA